MKLTVFISTFLLVSTVYTQKVIPFVDFNNFFQCFQNGMMVPVELQPVKNIKGGDNLVAYIDFRGNLIVYDGKVKKTLVNIEAEFEVSDNFVVWKVAETLNLWDAGNLKTLTNNVRNYWVKDHIVVFEDMRYNALQVYYAGEIYTLVTSTGTLSPPEFVSDNMVAFKDNGSFNKVFWRGEIYELEVWQSSYNFHAGVDMLAFNDPVNGTFAVFEFGEFKDLEELHVSKYLCGRGFVAYENPNGELMYYSDGERIKISNYAPDEWTVTDDVVFWMENGNAYAYIDNKKYQIANFKPKDFLIKNKVVTFRNIMGGVSALIDGKIITITEQLDTEYEIYGNSVLVKLFNNTYIIYSKGKKYRA